MIPLDDLLNIRFEFGQNCNSVFLSFFFNCTFSLSLCGGIKNKVDYILLQSLWMAGTLQQCHNERDGVSNHQPHDCLLNRLFGRRSKKTSKLSVTGLCEGNSPVTSKSPTQRASNAEYVSIWWRRHDSTYWCILNILRTDFRFWSSSVDFPHFGDISTVWIRPNLRFPGIFLRTQRGMA